MGDIFIPFNSNFRIKLPTIISFIHLAILILMQGFRHGRDRMVVGFTSTYATSAYHPISCEFDSPSDKVYSIQHYVIKFVSDLRQFSVFLWVLWFHPPIKLTAMI